MQNILKIYLCNVDMHISYVSKHMLSNFNNGGKWFCIFHFSVEIRSIHHVSAIKYPGWWRSCCVLHNDIPLTHWDRDKMIAFFQTTFSNAFFLNKKSWISSKISLKFIPKVPTNNNQALVQKMAWRWSGDNPLSETMMVNSLNHVCAIRP